MLLLLIFSFLYHANLLSLVLNSYKLTNQNLETFKNIFVISCFARYSVGSIFFVSLSYFSFSFFFCFLLLDVTKLYKPTDENKRNDIQSNFLGPSVASPGFLTVLGWVSLFLLGDTRNPFGLLVSPLRNFETPSSDRQKPQISKGQKSW